MNTRNARESLAPDDEQRQQADMARTLQRISRFLQEAGVVYAANCLHSFEGELSLAVAVVDFSYGDDAATAVRGTLRGILDLRGERWTASVIDAPIMATVLRSLRFTQEDPADADVPDNQADAAPLPMTS